MCQTSLGHRFCDRVCDTSEPDLFSKAEAKRYPCLIESSECVSPSLFPVEMGAECRTPKPSRKITLETSEKIFGRAVDPL